MRRLNGEDAGFLAMELSCQPMNTMAVGVFAPRSEPVTRAEVRAHLAVRLDQLPSFRWRILRVPFGLHQPVCVDDPDFDLDFHLRTATVDQPGGPAEVDRLFAAIAERHLDRRHPLWQATLVHGLAGGRQALILKYHHCLADGVAAFTTFSRVYADRLSPPHSPVLAPENDHAVAHPGASTAVSGSPLSGLTPFQPEPLPGRLRLLGAAVADHARALPSLPHLSLTTRRRFAAVKSRQATATTEVPGFTGDAPRTALNDAFTIDRSYTRAALDLADLKAVKTAAGVTLNDVILAVLAGATRRYLLDHDTLPDRPLLTSVPVSAEAPDAPTRQSGNRFWSFTTSLATDVADPVDRLQVISATAREAREQLELLGTDLMGQWLDRLPPAIAEPGARALVERLRTTDDDVDANILISNIRGPAERWRVFDTEVEDLYIDGPPSNGVGCNVMLWSYGDRVLIGILAFADALTDPPAFAAAIESSFAELHAAVLPNEPPDDPTPAISSPF